MSESEQPDDDTESARWLTPKRYTTAVAIAFVVAGAITAPLVFPEVHTARAIVGGAIFGVFCTFCVLMHWFFD